MILLILTLKNISKQYKDKVVLKDLSLDLREGVIGLLGPNGAGKTTLMRIMADILRPTTGSILVDGIDKNILNDGYRDILGYLPQDLGLYRNFTARNLLLYIAALKGLEKRKARSKTEELIELVGLKDNADKHCRALSGGMRRRLGIAQALLNDPRILILDEPTSGLDPKERSRFRNLLSRISGDRIILLSTHIVSDLDMLAGSVILLKDGSVLRQGSGDILTEELKGKVWSVIVPENSFPEYEARYLVSNVSRRDNMLELRVVSEERPGTDAKTEPPTLEDMYLYFFNEKSLYEFEEEPA